MPAKKKSSASKVTKTNPKQSKKTTEESYDSSNITVLKGLEAVKKRSFLNSLQSFKDCYVRRIIRFFGSFF